MLNLTLRQLIVQSRALFNSCSLVAIIKFTNHVLVYTSIQKFMMHLALSLPESMHILSPIIRSQRGKLVYNCFFISPLSLYRNIRLESLDI